MGILLVVSCSLTEHVSTQIYFQDDLYTIFQCLEKVKELQIDNRQVSLEENQMLP